MDFRSSLVFEFLLNKCPNFHDFSSLLFETVFYSKQSSITEFTVLGAFSNFFSEIFFFACEFLDRISLNLCLGIPLAIARRKQIGFPMSSLQKLKKNENDNLAGDDPEACWSQVPFIFLARIKTPWWEKFEIKQILFSLSFQSCF